MSKTIVITNMPLSSGSAMRTVSAIYEDGECLKLSIHNSSSMIGDIYLGRIDNIVRNINSAFVSIEKDNTCYYSLSDNKQHYFFNPKNSNKPNQGDSVLVQVNKDATKLKPATLSSKVELAGYFIVLSLDVKGVHVSKKIKENDVINELKADLMEMLETTVSNELANSCIRPGFIIRSNAQTLKSVTPAIKEAKQKIEKFLDMNRKAMYYKAPLCIHKADPDYFGMIDDMPLADFDGIITDDELIYSKISERYGQIFSDAGVNLRLYKDDLLSLYNLYDINKQIERALSRKIWLKSGGYIIIDYTEAMTVIDVNSGKYVSKSKDDESREKAFYLVNTQAAVEIAKQLRLRNISGMILVDFINMKSDEHVQGIVKTLRDEFKKDSVTTTYIDMTKLGLVEITRKRVGAMLKEYINQEVTDEL